MEKEMKISRSDNELIKPTPMLCSWRLALSIVGFLGFLNLYALRINMSVALVCMVNHTAVREAHNPNDTAFSEVDEACDVSANSSSDQDGEFVWDKEIQGFVLSSFFWGYFITQIPGGWLAARLGGKQVYGLFMLGCAVVTLLTPLAARVHVNFLISLRFLAGVAQGVVFPAMQDLWAHWAPPLESSFLGGFSYAGTQIGNVITLPFAAFLCENGFAGGWPSIFYVLGAFGLVWFVCWELVTANSPGEHRFISEAERRYIEKSLEGKMTAGKRVKKIPWLRLVRSMPVWAIVVTHTCANWGTYTFLTNIPTYMKEVLHFDIKKNGLLSAVPYIGFWLMINVSAFIADQLRSRQILNTTQCRKIFNTIGELVPAAFVIATGFMDCTRSTAAVVLLAIGVSMSGCQYGSGFLVNPVDIAPRYAGTIMGISNTSATISGFLSPIAIGYLTTHQTRAEWQNVFYLAAGIYTFGAIFYIIFGSGELQEWARETAVMDVEVDGVQNGGVAIDDVKPSLKTQDSKL